MSNYEIRNPGDDGDRHGDDVGSSYEIPPQTTEAPRTSDADEPGYLGGLRLAPQGRRYLAGALDFLIIPWVLINLLALGAELWPLLEPRGEYYVLWLLYNSVWLQGMDAQSVGKQMLGLKLVYPVIHPKKGLAWSFASPPRCLFRLVFHLVDWFWFFYGFFVRPFLDAERQTFADDWTGTLVVYEPNRDDVPDVFAEGKRALPTDFAYRRWRGRKRPVPGPGCF